MLILISVTAHIPVSTSWGYTILDALQGPRQVNRPDGVRNHKEHCSFGYGKKHPVIFPRLTIYQLLPSLKKPSSSHSRKQEQTQCCGKVSVISLHTCHRTPLTFGL